LQAFDVAALSMAPVAVAMMMAPGAHLMTVMMPTVMPPVVAIIAVIVSVVVPIAVLVSVLIRLMVLVHLTLILVAWVGPSGGAPDQSK
jgi:hypothetical protein